MPDLFTVCFETTCLDNRTKRGTHKCWLTSWLNFRSPQPPPCSTGGNRVGGLHQRGKGWRKYYVRGGSLSNAVAYLQQHCRLLLQQRIRVLELEWKRSGDPLPVELPQDESAPFSLGLVEHRPVLEGGQEHILPGWMNDFGLLGERPGKELEPTSLSVRLFSTLLHRNLPLSLDEAAELHDGPKARVGRILDRFRASGMVERIPRTDRLNTALWTAMTTQHQRRGEDWMLKKGGFQRLLSQPQQGALLKALAKGTLSVDGVASELNGVEPASKCCCSTCWGPTSNGVQNGRGDPRCGSSPSPGSPRSRPAEDGACGRSSRRGLRGRSMSVREGEDELLIQPKQGAWMGGPRPLFLAPMSGVTDLPYRLLAKECGADVTITEFTNSTALTRKPPRHGDEWKPTHPKSPSFPKSLGVIRETWQPLPPCWHPPPTSSI